MNVALNFRAALLLFLGLLMAGLCRAQSGLEVFLGSATQDARLQLYSDQLSYLGKRPYSLSPVRELEFRLQNKEIYAGERDYALRLSPANPWEIRNTSRYFKTYQASLLLERELALKELLVQRYALALEVIHLSNMHVLKEKQLKNIDYQLEVLAQQGSSDFFEEEEFVELSLEQFEEQTVLESLAFELNRKTAEVNARQALPAAGISDWHYQYLIQPQRLAQVADSLMQLPLYSTRLAYRQEQLSLARRAFALERSNFKPGFVQSEYMPYRESRGQYGFSLGVSLPLFNPNRGDMAEKRLEVLEATSELALEELQAREEVARTYTKLKAYLQRYQKLEQSLSSSRWEEMSKTVGALNKQNPLLGLKLAARQLKLERLKAELLQEIYQQYLELLSTSDLLVQRPLINYLSPQLRPL